MIAFAKGRHSVASGRKETQMPSNSRHVTPRDGGKDGWDVRKPNAQRASSVHSTQSDAIDAARESLGKSGGGELVLHNRQGQIRKKDTIPPAKDPFPPRG